MTGQFSVRAAAVVFLWVSGGHAVMCEPTTSRPVIGQENKIKYAHANNRVSIIYQVDKLAVGDRIHKLMNTGDWYVPKTVISSMQILFDGQRVYIPMSAVSDIYDPNKIQVDFKGGHYCINVVGGDGSESYETRLWFDSRHVFARESGDIGIAVPTERSTYLLIEEP